MTDLAMQSTVVDGVTKYTITFPLTDEAGQPILDRNGKPRVTNIIGDSPEEVVSKLAQANLEVTRALDRSNKFAETLKNKKPTPARPPADLKPKSLTADESMQVGLDLQDPRKAAAAIEKVVESRVAPVAGEVTRQAQSLDIKARNEIALQFIGLHRGDYWPADANNALLNGYLAANNLEFSLNNLEIAFAALADKLASRPAPPRNDPPAPPDNALPGNEPPNPGTPPSPQRRAPVSGIRESQASGVPLARQHFPYTKDQLLSMAYKRDPKYRELISNPATNAMVTAVLSGR
jgi:hypothetical protein